MEFRCGYQLSAHSSFSDHCLKKVPQRKQEWMSRVGLRLVRKWPEMSLQIITRAGGSGGHCLASSGDWLGTAPSFQANSFSQDCCVITSEVRRDIRHRVRQGGQDAVDWNMEPGQYIHASPVIRRKTVKWFCSEAILHWLYFAQDH